MITVKSYAQSDFDRSIDKENSSVVFKGRFTFEDLVKEPSFSWFEAGIKTYKPDTTIISFLKKSLNHYKLIVVMGTWCDDSQNLIPKLYKTLTKSNFPLNNLLLYGVDRAKETKYIEHKLYNITLVPTIIVFRNNREIGRITETIQKSIEGDLKEIIEKDLNATEMN